MTDTIGAAIEHLYKQKVLGAPVRDPMQGNGDSLADCYVGLLDFASLVLWALQVSTSPFGIFFFNPLCYVRDSCKINVNNMELQFLLRGRHA